MIFRGGTRVDSFGSGHISETGVSEIRAWATSGGGWACRDPDGGVFQPG